MKPVECILLDLVGMLVTIPIVSPQTKLLVRSLRKKGKDDREVQRILLILPEDEEKSRSILADKIKFIFLMPPLGFSFKREKKSSGRILDSAKSDPIWSSLNWIVIIFHQPPDIIICL